MHIIRFIVNILEGNMLALWRSKQCCILGSLILFGVVGGSIDDASADLVIHEIPPLNGLNSSKAYGINNNGKVCGKSYTTDSDDKAMVWTLSGGLVALPSLGTDTETSTWDINDSGQVSGLSRTDSGDKRGVWWDTDLTIEDIGVLQNTTTSAYGDEGTAYGIGNDGGVLGYAEIPNDAGDFTPYHAIVYDGSLQDLGTLNTTAATYQNGYSISYNKNSNQEIVGTAYTDSSTYKPFIWDSTNLMQELPVDSSYDAGEWYATVINNNGMIGGHVIVSGEGTFPYYWEDKNSTPARITLPSEFPNGEIYGINAAGLMVGIMWNNDTEPVEHAFVYDSVRGVRDLNELISSSEGWVLQYAREINNFGQVVGAGKKGSEIRGYMIEGIAMPGDINCDSAVGLADIITALQVTSSAAPKVSYDADMDGDGTIGVDDAIATLKEVAGN